MRIGLVARAQYSLIKVSILKVYFPILNIVGRILNEEIAV